MSKQKGKNDDTKWAALFKYHLMRHGSNIPIGSTFCKMDEFTLQDFQSVVHLHNYEPCSFPDDLTTRVKFLHAAEETNKYKVRQSKFLNEQVEITKLTNPGFGTLL